MHTCYVRSCRPWLMAHIIGRRHLQDKNIPMSVHEGFGCNRIPLANVAFQVRIYHIRCIRPRVIFLAVGQNLRTKCMYPRDDTGTSHSTLEDRGVQVTNNAGRPRFTLVKICVHATDNVVRSRLTSTKRCVQDAEDVGRPCPMSTDHFAHDKVNPRRPNSTSTDHYV